MKLFAALTAGAAALVLVLVAPAQAQTIDVVFKIDESGSMRQEIVDIQANVVTIFNALPAGSAVGLVGYGTRSHGGGVGEIPHITSHTALTTVQATFQTAVNNLVASGGLEQGYRAVFEAASDTIADGSLLFTPGAPYCNILITDERLNQGGRTQAEAIAAMNAVGGIFFGILPIGPISAEAQPLAAATGGQLFDLVAFRGDPTAVIDAVLAACVEAATPVKIDIKPQSCPNPFKVKQRGVIPVAILGTEDFDVTSVDPDTVTLEMDCPALRSNIEDVATPFGGEFSDPPFEDECTTAGADGFDDLTLKFDSQCVAGTMPTSDATDVEVLLWTIRGILFDGTVFEAQDVVRIMP